MSSFKRATARRRQGSTMVIVAGGMVMLLACVALGVDYSVLLADKNQLQRACDAAALAGASYLQRTGNSNTDRRNATNEAVRVAKLNGLSNTEAVPAGVTISDGDTKLKFTAQRPRALYFARVVGLFNGWTNAAATAAVNPQTTPQIIPIGITPETYDLYKSDTTARDLTLCNLQHEEFQRRADLTPYDPFVVTDFRGEVDNGERHGSPSQMQRQIDGTDKENVILGTQAYNLRNEAQDSFFKDGMGTLFNKAAGTPWFDPATGPGSPNWTAIGDKFDAIYSGTVQRDNPRVVNLFVTDGTTQQTGNYAFTVKAFAPVYIQQIRDDSTGKVIMTVRFLPPESSFGSQPVGLID